MTQYQAAQSYQPQPRTVPFVGPMQAAVRSTGMLVPRSVQITAPRTSTFRVAPPRGGVVATRPGDQARHVARYASPFASSQRLSPASRSDIMSPFAAGRLRLRRRDAIFSPFSGTSSQEQINQQQHRADWLTRKAREWWEDRQTGVLGSMPEMGAMAPVYYAVSLASGAVSAYHGVKRNNGSVGWGVGWFILGSAFPIVVPVIAYAQGFAKPKAKKNRRKTSRR